MPMTILTRPAAVRFSIALFAMALPAGPAAAEKLSGAALQSFISGKRVYLAVPLGGELPLTYHRSGMVDGSGEAVGLGRYMTPKDSGRWWLAGDRLCQRWKQWYDGRTFCFTVTKTSGNTIRWVRDDGKSGTARLR